MHLSQSVQRLPADEQTWLGSAHGTDLGITITLDTSTFTKSLHYPDGYFPSGLLLGRILETGLHGPYDNVATDGRQTAVGLLLDPVIAPKVDTMDVQGNLFWHGRVRTFRMPMAFGQVGGPDNAWAFKADLPTIRFDY